MIVEAAISYVLTFVLTLQLYLLVRPIMDYSSFGTLTAWTSTGTPGERLARRACAGKGPSTTVLHPPRLEVAVQGA